MWEGTRIHAKTNTNHIKMLLTKQSPEIPKKQVKMVMQPWQKPQF